MTVGHDIGYDADFSLPEECHIPFSQTNLDKTAAIDGGRRVYRDYGLSCAGSLMMPGFSYSRGELVPLMFLSGG
jgi:hypothetical protein